MTSDFQPYRKQFWTVQQSNDIKPSRNGDTYNTQNWIKKANDTQRHSYTKALSNKDFP